MFWNSCQLAKSSSPPTHPPLNSRLVSVLKSPCYDTPPRTVLLITSFNCPENSLGFISNHCTKPTHFFPLSIMPQAGSISVWGITYFPSRSTNTPSPQCGCHLRGFRGTLYVWNDDYSGWVSFFEKNKRWKKSSKDSTWQQHQHQAFRHSKGKQNKWDPACKHWQWI